MLLPATCPCCGAVGPAPCERCRLALRPPVPAPAPPGVDGWAALFRYEGVGRELVARLKYRNARSSVAWLAEQLAARVDPARVDVVTWVPTTAQRRRARGFDQAELLARAVARRLRRPCRPLVRRAPGAPQTGRSGAARRRDLGLRPLGGAPARVLVVDDVATTGVTLSSVAVALRRAGTVEVWALTAARTPRCAGGLPSAVDAVSREDRVGHQGQRPPHRDL